jgi:lycopene cyclase domain-containing protein
VWSFNEDYITGIKIFNLPIEELLFFFVIPYCCIFIYECIKIYFPNLKRKRSVDTILILLAVFLCITGIIFINKSYTTWTFILTAIFIAAIYLFKQFFKNFKSELFLVSYCIMLIPFLIVNGFLTSIPVVLYNDAENLGIRFFTIPFEDCFYGLLLILMSVTIYEKLRVEH